MNKKTSSEVSPANSGMSTKLADFILRLGDDPAALAEFKRDPPAAIREAHLTPAEEAVLLGGNPAELRLTIASQLGISAMEAAARDWVIVIISIIIQQGLQ
jgi:hypothetical protein